MKVFTVFLFISIIPVKIFAQKDTSAWKIPTDKYVHAGPWAANGLAMVCKSGSEQCGCIDTAGNELIPFIYGMDYSYFFDGTTVFNSANRMVAAKRHESIDRGVINGKAAYGIINEKGETVLPFEYGTDYRTMRPLDPYHVFYTKSAPRQYGAVDSLGNVVIPFEYEHIEKAGENRFVVQKNKQYGLLDNKGQVLLPLGSFTTIAYNFFFRVLFVEKSNQWGVYSLNGKEILPVQYSSVVFTVDGGYLVAETNNSINFFTPEGKLLKTIAIDYPLKRADSKSQTTFPFHLKQNKKWGTLNSALQMSVPFEYDFLSSPYFLPAPFSLSPVIYHVKKNGREAYIDTANRLLCTMWFDTIVAEGQGVVKKDGLYGWVNSKAQLHIPVKYESLRPIRKNGLLAWDNRWEDYFFIVKKNGGTGVLDYNDNLILPYDKTLKEVTYVFQPDSMETIFIIGKKNGKYGAFKTGGQIAVPFEYDNVQADFYKSIKYDGHFQFIKDGNAYTVNWKTFKLEKQ